MNEKGRPNCQDPKKGTKKDWKKVTLTVREKMDKSVKKTREVERRIRIIISGKSKNELTEKKNRFKKQGWNVRFWKKIYKKKG